jgi:hypothetical protein
MTESGSADAQTRKAGTENTLDKSAVVQIRRIAVLVTPVTHPRAPLCVTRTYAIE